MNEKEFQKYILDAEDKNLSLFATKNSAAQRQTSTSHPLRGPFSRDRDHILYSGSFRRYIGKTQVIYNAASFDEQLANRSIHTLQVSQIARSIGKVLKLNQDLIEAIALGHDLGHAPFGHDGERILQEICEKHNLGLFFHNVHSLRVVDVLSNANRGMNLTFQVRDGIISHDGEVNENTVKPDKSKTEEDIQDYIRRKQKGEKAVIFPSTLEGCLVRFTDSISYIGQDFEDAIRIGLIKKKDLPEDIRDKLGDNNSDIIDTLVRDVIEQSYEKNEIMYSKDIAECVFLLKTFNFKHIYENKALKKEREKIRKAFFSLFDYFVNAIKEGKKESIVYREWIFNRGEDQGKEYLNTYSPEEVVVDYLASMTDRYFLNAYENLILGK
ncbi:MAG: HD domain-containing protein [Atribacterota bacterium]|jgi:dGTPase|nr:HD domain-containing protein [Atribacterota bacterium]MDD3640967.1 HD domain-containing protein [Atribacterota bacterium]MDD4289136.1 HD domain-containing protein [Atribacterota bacterium]MDI9596559.1 HD domain-containing protein [Atribacterota bacterium]